MNLTLTVSNVPDEREAMYAVARALTRMYERGKAGSDTFGLFQGRVQVDVTTDKGDVESACRGQQKPRVLHLTGGIKITLEGVDRESSTLCFKGGTISGGTQKELCNNCRQADCCFSCDEAQGPDGTRRLVPDPFSRDDESAVASRLQFNGAVDGIQSLVLAHAIAGIDVESPAYEEGIETAMQAASNNL